MTGPAAPAPLDRDEQRLQHLAALPENWNSYGSPPITAAAIAAARKWLASIVIIPRNNGGLMLGVDENGQAVTVEPDGSFAACDCGEPARGAVQAERPRAPSQSWLPDTFIERAYQKAQNWPAGNDSLVKLTAFEASAIRQRGALQGGTE